jgi:hypothetical protein
MKIMIDNLIYIDHYKENGNIEFSFHKTIKWWEQLFFFKLPPKSSGESDSFLHYNEKQVIILIFISTLGNLKAIKICKSSKNQKLNREKETLLNGDD